MQPTDSRNQRPQQDTAERLDSWKEIASYLGRAVRTVQTWEREEGLPVRRHQHLKGGTVYAYRSEIDAWREGREELGDKGHGVWAWLSRRSALRWTVGAAVILAVAVGWGWVSRASEESSQPGGSALAFKERDWLLIAEVHNRTAEELFDGTLESALRRELVNSSFVNVVSPERVADSLRLMRLPADTPIDALLARELAVRDGGIGAVLVGRVGAFGASYLLSVDLLDPVEGVTVASFNEAADGADGVLRAVSALSIRVRESLGEVLPEIDAQKESLKRVSTPSLRALQLYSRADRLLRERREGANRAAAELLSEAISEDPEFASSHTHLAWALGREGGASHEILSHAKRALDLADGATTVERYFIQGSYFTMLSAYAGRSSDLEAALAQYEALLELDPGHFWAIGNTFDALEGLGRGQETLEVARRLVEARPNDITGLSRAAHAVVAVKGDLKEARSFVWRAQELQSELPVDMRQRDPFLEFYRVHELWVAGDIEGVAREVEKALERLGDLPAAERVGLAGRAADIYVNLGMFDNAEALFSLYGFVRPRRWRWKMAWARGESEVVRELIHWRAERGDQRLMAELAFELAMLGYLNEAETFLERLPEGFDVEVSHIDGARGIIDFGKGRYEEAISRLEEASPRLRYHRDLRNYFFAARTLSRAWEAIGRSEQAVAVLEQASRQKPSVIWARVPWMKLQLRLAAVYRGVGRNEEALAIEDELHSYCIYAQPDFPMLRDLQGRQVLPLSGARGGNGSV